MFRVASAGETMYKLASGSMNARTLLRFFVCSLVVCAVAPLLSAQVSDFTVLKSGPATAAPDTDVTFSITVTNNGPNAGSVTMTDAIAGGWSFVSVSPTGGFACSSPAVGATSGNVSCTNASMAVGSAVITLVLHMNPLAPPETTFTNTATVASATDPNGGNNSSTASVTTPPVTDISVSKTGPAIAAADTDVSLTITVTNLGPSNVTTGVTLTDAVMSGWSFVSVTPAAGFSCTDPGAGATSGTVSCTAATMTAGSSAVFTIVFHIPPATPPGTAFTNTAIVSSQFDSNSENDSSTAVTRDRKSVV